MIKNTLVKKYLSWSVFIYAIYSLLKSDVIYHIRCDKVQLVVTMS